MLSMVHLDQAIVLLSGPHDQDTAINQHVACNLCGGIGDAVIVDIETAFRHQAPGLAFALAQSRSHRHFK